MLTFWISEHFEKHPYQQRIASWWIKRGLPLPEKIKRQIINQIHTEMIFRLMDVGDSR